jgi:hypothetical protein
MNVVNRPVEADETNRMISSEKVDGTAVYNTQGEKLGSIHHLMIDTSAAGWAGSGHLVTIGVPWWRPISVATSE